MIRRVPTVAKLKSDRTFPWTERIEGQEITFRLLTPKDRDLMLEFTRGLTSDDMMYLRLDISQAEVLDEWLENTQNGKSITVLALDESGEVGGYCSLHRNLKSWTRHIGEIRVFVKSDMRGLGLARRLVNEIFQIAKQQNVQRLVVNIARDQLHIQQMLQRLGFKVEALLTDWLMSRDGHTHDLVIMSHSVDEY